MDGNQSTLRREEQEGKETEEYVLLDLDSVYGQVSIPPNAPYVLSGLDTLNPILIIDDKFELIGEYEETIGTCLVFSETDGAVVVHEETGPSEANLISERCIIDTHRSMANDVKPVASLHRILKFRLITDEDSNDLPGNVDSNVSTDKQANDMNE